MSYVKNNATIKINRQSLKQRFKAYKKSPFSFILLVLVILAALITAAILLFLVGYVLIKGIPHITPSLFEWKYSTANVSLMPSLINTITMTAISLIIAVPVGIFSAIYLVEYAKRGNKVVGVIQITTETLSGIPSIVYGLFGALFFVETLKFGKSLIAGAFTLGIMILPFIIRTTEEALKGVPDSYREGGYGLGAGRLRTVFKIVLPSAIPGILAGVILAVGRIVGETAALLYTAGSVPEVAFNLGDSGRTLSVHMYALSSEGFNTDQAYATAVILLLIVILINWLSGFIAKKLTEGKK